MRELWPDVGSGRSICGARAHCPACGGVIAVPKWAQAPDDSTDESDGSNAGEQASSATPGAPEDEEIVDAELVDEPVVEFLDPPAAPAEPKQDSVPKVSVMRRMFEAMLDPQSIQWMLVVGGVLAVLGLIIWVVSLGIFENRVIVAFALGVGTFLILSVGWFVSLKTRYKTAGHALAFLGCVVMPLNLWYYHAQDLLRLEDHLWIGGVICCLLYALMVRVLRNPLFMYAVEAGVTLTVLLFLAGLSLPFDSSLIAIGFMVLGLMSIHAERAFPPDEGEFRRERFGLPLFWSGQVQIGISLFAVVVLQMNDFLGRTEVDHKLLAAGLWLAGAYAYLYSDLVVRRVGVYVYVAALALLASLLTLVAGYFDWEVAIVVLTLMALAANMIERKMVTEQRFSRIVAPLGIFLGGVPLLLGWLLHVCATSSVARTVALELGWHGETTAWFVGAMLVVAIGTRISAWLYRSTAPRRTVVYLFYSAAALIIAAAGTLRAMDIVEWSRQAPLLMVIPIAYLVAARLWRGQLEERALGWVARTAAAVILIHGLLSVISLKAMFVPTEGEIENLMLGIVFVEAAIFYALVATFRHYSAGGYLSAASACAAMWQFLGYLASAALPSHVDVCGPRDRCSGLREDSRSNRSRFTGPVVIERMATRGRGARCFPSGQCDSECCVYRGLHAGSEPSGHVRRRLAPAICPIPDGRSQLYCGRRGTRRYMASRVCRVFHRPGRAGIPHVEYLCGSEWLAEARNLLHHHRHRTDRRRLHRPVQRTRRQTVRSRRSGSGTGKRARHDPGARGSHLPSFRRRWSVAC